MKSLDQIEARTPISSAPFTISAPGSYYLTTNLTTAVSNAILINWSRCSNCTKSDSEYARSDYR
jgi:hypothetical protein